MPDVCALLSGIGHDVRALKNNFIDEKFSAPGIVWKNINGHVVGYRQYGGWIEQRSVNFHVIYTQTVIYSGSTMTLNLDFPANIMLRRIESISSDDTAKNYEVREYLDFMGDTKYNLLDAGTANQDERWILPFENHFMPAGSRIQFYFSTFTATKSNKIAVAVEEI